MAAWRVALQLSGVNFRAPLFGGRARSGPDAPPPHDLASRLRGRDWRLYLPLVPVLAWFTWHHTRDAGYRGIYQGLNLALHEGGHLFLMWFGIDLLTVAGGTLFEVGIPLLVALYFWRQGDAVGSLVATFWAGTALLSVAPYMADARVQVLPLVTVGDGPVGHDWFLLLEAVGLLGQDEALARMVRGVGLALLWACTAALVWLLREMREVNRRPADGGRGIDETAADRMDRPPFDRC